MQQVKALEKKMEELMGPFEEPVKKLMEIPGVGVVTALTALAVLSEVKRFPSVKHVASYVGITPRMKNSGETERSGHITKSGSPALRALLVEAAHHARRPDHPLNPYFMRLACRRG